MTVKSFGGINFLASLIIISIGKVKEKVFGKKKKLKEKKRKSSWGISVLVIGVVIIFLSYLVAGNVLFRTIYISHGCEIVYNQVGERNIVIRIDDIQAYSWTEVQEKIISDAKERGLTLVLGIIPNALGKYGFTDDADIYGLVEKNKCNMEIALHGYTHEESYGEFSSLSFKEADTKIKEGIKILEKIGIRIITFIPPNNNISEEAINAVESNKIKVISSGYLSGEYGLTSSTFNSQDENTEDYKVILERCEKSLDENKTCVIVVHPQDYIDKEGNLDKTKYKNYIRLLDGIENLDAEFVVNFRDLYYKDVIRLN